jgi:hypothetical protein
MEKEPAEGSRLQRRTTTSSLLGLRKRKDQVTCRVSVPKISFTVSYGMSRFCFRRRATKRRTHSSPSSEAMIPRLAAVKFP